MSEAVVLELLNELKARGKTVLLITHRSTTMEAADRFLLLADRKLYAFDDCAAGGLRAPARRKRQRWHVLEGLRPDLL